MTRPALEVSPLVRRKAAELGARGDAWVAGLGDLLADLEREWSITAAEPLSGGSASHVMRVRTADRRDAVLKLALPGPDFSGEVRTLTAAQGRGYAHLLAYDTDRQAMLLESLGPSLSRSALGPEQTIGVLCRMLRQAWQVPVSTDLTDTHGDEKAGQLGRLVAELWDKLDRPLSSRVVEQALRFADQRRVAFDPQRCVVVHGDPHPDNALRVPTPRAGAESGFVFVDPDGFLCDPAYDLGVVLRDWCAPLLAGDCAQLARHYCRLLAEGTGVDETAIWEWGFLERVSTGLYVLDLGAEEMARPFLMSAERLV